MAPTISRFKNSIKTLEFTPPFSLIINRIFPFDVIADIRLMPYLAPVASTTAFHLFLPHGRPA